MTHNNSNFILGILSLITTLLCAVLVFGVYNIKSKNQEISELLNLADNVNEEEALIRSIQAMQNDAREDLEAFEAFTPSDKTLVPLIVSIEGAGRAFGLETKIVSVNKIEDKKAAVQNIIRIAIETKGTWAASLSFLRAVENLPRQLVIEEASQYKEETIWRSRIILSLYSFD